MMSLYETIKNDYKQAMKQKDTNKKYLLNYIISSIKYFEKEKGEVTDEDIISLLKKEIKNKKESIEYAEKNQDTQEVESQKKGISILENYLPEIYSYEYTKKLIEDFIKEENIQNITKERWKIMKYLVDNYKSYLDMDTVNDILNKKINNAS